MNHTKPPGEETPLLDRLDPLLDRLEQLAWLKEVPRTGWVLRGVERPESVADHSWGTAQLCLLLAPAGVDRFRAVAMAVVHDIAEVETGDIPRRASADAQPLSTVRKEQLEEAALERLCRDGLDVPGGISPDLASVGELWREYARGETETARFVRDMNLIDMCLQAVVYERGRRYDPEENQQAFPDYPRLEEFFATSRSRFCTILGKRLFGALELRYQKILGEGHGET
ncbi:HD domain-containing protein [Alkalispirochaeta americana]|uniref:HD domain-containing protein n=1 Tax=Alkalispirochaeta americana TaxID=159291 RepID=UPI00190E673E|nr:HD domain-containing protein [Alkalispirochaeta americana]